MKKLYCFVLTFPVFLMNGCIDSKERCTNSLIKYYKPKYASGVVSRKYISNNHAMPSLDLIGFKGGTYLLGMYSSFDDGLWSSVEVGDTIYKEAGTLVYRVKTKDGREMEFEFNCDGPKENLVE